jgi:ATP-binding cassette subfamily B protein
VQSGLAQVGGVATEALSGIATVKAFHQEQREVARYESAQAGYLSSLFRVAAAQAGLVAFVMSGMSLAVVAVIWHGVDLVREGALTGGELTRFVIYTAFMAGGMGLIADRFGAVQRALGATQRLRELLRQEVELVTPDTALTTGWRGEVEFRDVSFSYPSRPGAPVLKHFSLRIAAGECLALVGPSGAGKTTIAALLLRFYDPGRGQVLLDGRALDSYSLAELRRHFALVPQEVVLFSGTIAENIAYGRAEATSAEIEAAARQAHAHEFITGLPDGYATKVGERGVQLSGGQRQRVAIARCILRNPAVLILDEATSALDSESERLLRAAMQTVVAGRTTLIIAHRPSTMKMAHRVAVLDRGELVEFGTHEELMLRDAGMYRSLAAPQLAASHSEWSYGEKSF